MHSYIGISAENTWISRLVRWFSQSPYSHAMILVNGYVYESDPKGFVKIPLAEYDQTIIKKLYNINIEVYEADLRILESWVSRPYGWWELIGQALKQLLRRISLRIRNPFKSATGLMCSEAVVDWLKVLHFPNSEDLIPEDMDPEDVDDFLGSSPYAALIL